MSLDQDKSFYCVVDGMVQVFAQTDQTTDSQQGLWDHEDMNGYQLLNEVGSGGTLSSLFTILSLFTEDVKMSWQDELPDIDESAPSNDSSDPSVRHQEDSDVPQFDLGKKKGPTRKSSISSASSTVHPSGFISPSRGRSSSPSLYEEPYTGYVPPIPQESEVRPRSVHRGVVARATEDTTLAVIPAEAFRRLTKNFPKATGHIVQGFICSDLSQPSFDTILSLVILTRFSRATFNAAHKYLGLTSEVLRTEKSINDIACHPLPASFYKSGGLQYLRQRFDGISSDTESDYFSHTNSPAPQSRSKSNKSSSSSSKVNLPEVPLGTKERKQSLPFARGSRDTVQPGDLLIASGSPSGVYRPPSRSYSILNTPRIPHDLDLDHNLSRMVPPFEDFDLRQEVMSCIAKSIGLLQPPLSGSDSVEASPAIHPTDAQFPAGAFSSPFGSLSLLDGGDDTSSLAASSIMSTGDYMGGLDNEVEILFFPAGSILAKAGELNTGKQLWSGERRETAIHHSSRLVLCN